MSRVKIRWWRSWACRPFGGHFRRSSRPLESPTASALVVSSLLLPSLCPEGLLHRWIKCRQCRMCDEEGDIDTWRTSCKEGWLLFWMRQIFPFNELTKIILHSSYPSTPDARKLYLFLMSLSILPFYNFLLYEWFTELTATLSGLTSVNLFFVILRVFIFWFLLNTSLLFYHS